MPTPTMRDPKQVLNEAIDKAFARDRPDKSERKAAPSAKSPMGESHPTAPRRIGLIGAVIATTITLSVLATFLMLLVNRRRAPLPKTRLLFGKPARHVGYGRYHLGRIGTAFILYTYKLPRVRYQWPPLAYKLPPIRVRLPLPRR